MSTLQKIRLGAAIVLLCAIFLPLSQCSQGGAGSTETPQAFAHGRHVFPRSDNDFSYNYGIKRVVVGFISPREDGLAGALTLIAFAWPLALAIWSQKSGLHRFWWMFYTGELLLCAGTVYWVHTLTQSGRLLYGFYVAEAAIAIYTTATLVFIGNRLRNFFRNRAAVDPR